MKSPASEPGLRRFVSSSLSVSPCPPECYLQSEMKIEPDLRFNYSIDIFLGFHNAVIHVNFCAVLVVKKVLLTKEIEKMEAIWTISLKIRT